MISLEQVLDVHIETFNKLNEIRIMNYKINDVKPSTIKEMYDIIDSMNKEIVELLKSEEGSEIE